MVISNLRRMITSDIILLMTASLSDLNEIAVLCLVHEKDEVQYALSMQNIISRSIWYCWWLEISLSHCLGYFLPRLQVCDIHFKQSIKCAAVSVGQLQKRLIKSQNELFLEMDWLEWSTLQRSPGLSLKFFSFEISWSQSFCCTVELLIR